MPITTDEYLDCADSVHSNDPQNTNIPVGFTCTRAEISHAFFGTKQNRNGFQAAVYTHNATTEKVLAIAGTQGAPLNDVLADVRLLVQLMPRQASSALKFFQSSINANDIAVIVGHSLGGALAQVLGYWCNRPFITFNAPGVAQLLGAARFNFFKPQVMMRTWSAKKERSSAGASVGINFVTPGDMVASFGRHVGDVYTLPGAPAKVMNHGLPQLTTALQRFTNAAGALIFNLDPFAHLP